MGSRALARVVFAGLVVAVGAAPCASAHHARSTLGKPQRFPIPAADVLQPVSAADITGDGRKDIVVGDFFEERFYELDGRKGKSFKPPKTFNTATESEGLALADINHDHQTDVISTGSFEPTSVVYDIAYPTYTVASFGSLNGFSVNVADVNHDHNQDILTADFLGEDVGVLLGEPTGVGGSTPQTSPTPSSPLTVIPQKINGDQDPDLAVLENSSDLGADLLIMYGDGNGAFSQGPIRILSSNQASGMVAGRFNGDKRSDLAIDDCARKHTDVYLMYGKKGGFKAPKTFKAPAASCPHEPAAGDINGDGRLDLVLAVAGDTDKHSGSLEVLYGTRKGFGKAHRFRAVHATDDLAVADMNHDGRQDVIVSDRNDKAVAVLYGKKR